MKRIVNCPHCGKILSPDLWEKQKTINSNSVKCPECGSTKVWKGGKRLVSSGVIQRYYCNDCGLRFSFH